MKKLPPSWETERMSMREITGADTDFIVALRRKPDVYRYFTQTSHIKNGVRTLKNQYFSS